MVAISNDLREKVIAKESFLTEPQRKLIYKNIDLPLNELMQIDVMNDVDVANYWICLVLYKVKEQDPVGPNGVSYSLYFEHLYDQNPPYKDSLCTLYASFVIREIMACKDIAELEVWMGSMAGIKTRNLDITNILTAATVIYSNLMWGRIEDTMDESKVATMMHYLADLKKGQDFQIDNNDLIAICLNNICKVLETQNDLFGLLKCQGKVTNKDYRGARQVLACIHNISFTSEELKARIQKIQEVVGEPTALDQGSVLGAGSRSSLSGDQAKYALDFTKLKFESTIYAHQTDMFGVVIYKASHPEQPLLAVKEYTAKKSISDLDKFRNELKILEILSDRVNETNCFLKFYGSWTVENRLFLVMEYAEHSLMSIITEYKKLNFHLTEDHLKGIIIQLLTSFAQMETMRIYHQDIKPHNLLVGQNFDIKIIDFSISEVKTEIDIATLATGQNPVQGTKGYMAPELQACIDNGTTSAKFKPGKADVFSLGLTILQLVLMEDLFTLNRAENNARLLERVSSLPYEWLKSLLNSMLALDYHNRKSFRHLLALVPLNVITDSV